MAEGSSTSSISGENSNSSVELKIKTLDSRIFSFQVEKNMTVSLFKEKIATETGVPVGQQRLIFRGKVLKDDHPLSEYHIENGDTLHLVERQPAQSQASSDTSAGATNGNSNRGTDGGTGNGRNRIGHISHSVVLGTFNVGDQAQGEGSMPDISRVIGAVLNSFGVGGQPTTNVSDSAQFPSSASQRNETNGARGSTDSQSQTQPAQSFPGHISQQSSPQAVQIPLNVAAVPLPSFHSPIPDSLRTVSEFIVRMEQALTQNGNQPNASSGNTENLPRVELPSDVRGLPTVEALSIVLRRMQRLLGSNSVNAISHIADRLEQERDSSDPNVRGEIQTEAVRAGVAMQHLGALLLELGRTMLTLRMGQSPVESSINAGPAVYISQAGPNPIMVQPFPLQTSSLFSGSNLPPNPTTSGPVGIGHAPRHINIHIHAGGSSLAHGVSGVDSRASNGEGTQGERSSNTGSGSTRGLRTRTVIAPSPVRPSGSGFAPGAQLTFNVPTSQPPSDSSLATSVAEVNSLIRNMVNNVQGERQVASGNGSGNEHPNVVAASGAAPGVPLPTTMADPEVSKKQCDGTSSSNEDTSSSKVEGISSSSEVPANTKSAPLGLGLGGLERKKPTKKPTSTSQDQNLNARTVGQQLLQNFASRATPPTRPPVNEAPSANPVVVASGAPGGQGSGNPVDAAAAVSQVLQSPALNGLLSGFSEQAGVGSPDMLRNMLQQLTQSPQIMSTVSQIAQQVDGQDLGNMFSGLGGGAQGGGLDLSQMIQQMMPVVSQAFSRGSNAPQQPFSVMEPESRTTVDARRSGETTNPQFQIDAQEIAERVVEYSDSPREVFRAVAENAVPLNASEMSSEDLLKELLGDDELTNEYSQLLQRDIRRRFESDRSDG